MSGTDSLPLTLCAAAAALAPAGTRSRVSAAGTWRARARRVPAALTSARTQVGGRAAAGTRRARAHGIPAALTPAATSDLFAGPEFSSVFGSFQAFLCLGAALGSWGAGKIFDVTGCYTLALWLAFAAALAAPTLMWFAAPSRPKRPRS